MNVGNGRAKPHLNQVIATQLDYEDADGNKSAETSNYKLATENNSPIAGRAEVEFPPRTRRDAFAARQMVDGEIENLPRLCRGEGHPPRTERGTFAAHHQGLRPSQASPPQHPCRIAGQRQGGEEHRTAAFGHAATKAAQHGSIAVSMRRGGGEHQSPKAPAPLHPSLPKPSKSRRRLRAPAKRPAKGARNQRRRRGRRSPAQDGQHGSGGRGFFFFSVILFSWSDTLWSLFLPVARIGAC
ncbi:hypothetical protein SETIT_4G074100v2 [Setaria italica]|uniref:Uncharacterized protein n=1 Tax=Setaria italica TaxID=4555 RepID=A0A368QRQ8_SETIT|nr:hypothetical protein SETIT_4G074100v2 [Setaria italica]